MQASPQPERLPGGAPPVAALAELLRGGASPGSPSVKALQLLAAHLAATSSAAGAGSGGVGSLPHLLSQLTPASVTALLSHLHPTGGSTATPAATQPHQQQTQRTPPPSIPLPVPRTLPMASRLRTAPTTVTNATPATNTLCHTPPPPPPPASLLPAVVSSQQPFNADNAGTVDTSAAMPSPAAAAEAGGDGSSHTAHKDSNTAAQAAAAAPTPAAAAPPPSAAVNPPAVVVLSTHVPTQVGSS
jgi:hypothetical protein